VQQQQRGNQQQAQQQQGVARQQVQQPQQQGMAQQRQPSGPRLQRVPLSAVLSPLDDFGPGFGRVGGFLRSIEDEMNTMMRVSRVLTVERHDCVLSSVSNCLQTALKHPHRTAHVECLCCLRHVQAMEYGDDMAGSTLAPSADTRQEPAAPLQVSTLPAARMFTMTVRWTASSAHTGCVFRC
jgi:hypothetical protein